MVVWARVRWFNTTRGYGFVVAEDGKDDILLNVKQLQAFGVSSVAEGARVLVRVETAARGLQVAEVLDIQPPDIKQSPAGAGPLEPARVKWFDPVRGYGFVNVYGRREDVYLHMATLREYGFGPVAEGNAIAVRVTEGPRGPTVCEVRDWDYPNRPRGRRRTPHRPGAPEGRSPRPDAGGRPPRADPDDVSSRAAAAILETLLAWDQLRSPGRSWGAARAGAVSDVEALPGLGHRARQVETFVGRMFGAE